MNKDVDIKQSFLLSIDIMYKGEKARKIRPAMQHLEADGFLSGLRPSMGFSVPPSHQILTPKMKVKNQVNFCALPIYTPLVEYHYKVLAPKALPRS